MMISTYRTESVAITEWQITIGQTAAHPMRLGFARAFAGLVDIGLRHHANRDSALHHASAQPAVHIHHTCPQVVCAGRQPARCWHGGAKQQSGT